MRKLRLLLGLCALLVLGVAGSTALAAPPGAGTCSGGTIDGGSYRGLTVTGNCTFADGATVTVNGNLTVADGAILNDHAGSTATVIVTGNVKVGNGAVLGLGNYEVPTGTTVYGNIVANEPLTLYLGGMTVHGNVVSNGGGDPGRNFPIKDDVIGGNLILQGWQGLWIGALRDTVGGNVIFSNNAAANPLEDPGADSSEVENNDIGGNLICLHNTPGAQIGDAEQPASRVAGNTIGECAGL